MHQQDYNAVHEQMGRTVQLIAVHLQCELISFQQLCLRKTALKLQKKQKTTKMRNYVVYIKIFSTFQ